MTKQQTMAEAAAVVERSFTADQMRRLYTIPQDEAQ